MQTRQRLNVKLLFIVSIFDIFAESATSQLLFLLMKLHYMLSNLRDLYLSLSLSNQIINIQRFSLNFFFIATVQGNFTGKFA